MKKVILILFVLSINLLSFGENKKGKETINIKTSAQCGMCKKTIETALSYEKGVKSSSLNLKTKILTVSYNPKKTNPETIKKAINKVGYDADDKLFEQSAYDKLPACCKKPADQ